MSSIIEAKYFEWTEGLSPEESRVNIFEKIRDIPYHIDLRLLSFENGPEGMLKAGRGSCSPKHYLLGMMLNKLGIPVKYCTYPFLWEDMLLDCPEVLNDLSGRIPVTYHHASRAFIGGEWVLLDATWDAPLKKAGFPVNEGWDGRQNTLLAVKALDEIVYDDPRRRDAALKKAMEAYSLPEKLELSRFTGEFNRWLGEIRKKE